MFGQSRKIEEMVIVAVCEVTVAQLVATDIIW